MVVSRKVLAFRNRQFEQVSKCIHHVTSIWSAPFQRAGQSRLSPTLSAKARRKAVSLCVKSCWSCPAGKKLKKKKGKRWKKESIEKQNSIDVVHMHHTMLWQDALLLSGLCFILIALVVIAWQLTLGLYSSLPFITKYYNMFTISPGIAIQSHDQHGCLQHITYNSFILVRMCLHSLHWCNLVQSFTAKKISSCPNSAQVVEEELAMSASTHEGNRHRRKCTAQNPS